MFFFFKFKEPFIRKFSITGLYGYKNIEMTFDDPVKILVGENGSGKTTILNCLYYTLKQKFDSLSKIRFSRIKIEFNHEKFLEFGKEEIEAIVEREKDFQNTPFYRSISQQLTPKDITELQRIIYSGKSELEQTKLIVSYIRKLGFNFKSPSFYIYNNVKRLVHEYMAISLEHRLEILDDVLKSDIFYYPTYRRIESALVNFQEISKKLSEINPFMEKIDLSKLFNSDDIQFGMDDVKKRIDNVTDIIYQTTMDGFSSIMGDMLSQLSKTIKSDEIKYNFDKKLIQIILDRLNDKIKPADKESIMAYATSGKLNNPNLNFLIAKLVSLYEEQKQYDKAIKCFRDTCNHYLNDKKFVYNESSIDLYVESHFNNERLDLECLSSGEKQIVSLFAKLYLEIDKSFIMLLDEPELSLSVTWQERLMPDIVHSNKCDFLLAVTHSPFIFNNELEECAQSLSDFIK